MRSSLDGGKGRCCDVWQPSAHQGLPNERALELAASTATGIQKLLKSELGDHRFSDIPSSTFAPGEHRGLTLAIVLASRPTATSYSVKGKGILLCCCKDSAKLDLRG